LDEYLVSPNDANIISAAFMSPCYPDRHGSTKISNPYYWHGRKDFPNKAQLSLPMIGSGESATDNQELTSFSLPFLDMGGPIPELGTNANQLALSPLSDAGINFDDTSKPTYFPAPMEQSVLDSLAWMEALSRLSRGTCSP
jgi:hypothetical protein